MRNDEEVLADMRRQLNVEPGEKVDPRLKGDYAPEVYFIGQIEMGTDFDVASGLFLEAFVKYGPHWQPLSQISSVQTHTAYRDEDGAFVWAHPFDIAFKSGSIYGWPKFLLRTWRLDPYGKIDTISYGVVSLPNEVGSFDVECPTWRPMGGWKDESYSFYLGGPPKLLNLDPLSRDLSTRQELSTMSSGTVHIHCEVIMKAFEDNSISGAQ